MLTGYFFVLIGCSGNHQGRAGRPSSAAGETIVTGSTRPNILLIVADDLGFSDIGSFGSEIAAPNLDALAASGTQLTNFHVAATCSPTRAMLLSGVDNHLAGLGAMRGSTSPEQYGQIGYEGYLNHNVVSIATLLREGGYHTYMVGKWHLGYSDDTPPCCSGLRRIVCTIASCRQSF